MKKIILSLLVMVVCAFASNTAYSQTVISKEHRFGGGLHYGNGDKNLANFIGFNFDFNSATSYFRGRVYLDQLQRAVPLKSLSTICLGIRGNAQYLFPLAENDNHGFYIYPSAGVGADWVRKGNWPKSKDKGYGIGMNFGGGAEYQFNSSWAMFAEIAYQIRFFSQNHVSFEIGLSYAFKTVK